jgi:ribosomal protein L30
MRYIDSFYFPGVEAEEQFVNDIRRTCYASFYPFGVFAENLLRELSFSEITILYGNNGSGKSTALNIMAEKLRIKQVRSIIGRPARQKRTMEALGLRRINHTREVVATPQILGMIESVKHLITVEEI